jgi:hypothetical protein
VLDLQVDDCPFVVARLAQIHPQSDDWLAFRRSEPDLGGGARVDIYAVEDGEEAVGAGDHVSVGLPQALVDCSQGLQSLLTGGKCVRGRELSGRVGVGPGVKRLDARGANRRQEHVAVVGRGRLGKAERTGYVGGRHTRHDRALGSLTPASHFLGALGERLQTWCEVRKAAYHLDGLTVGWHHGWWRVILAAATGQQPVDLDAECRREPDKMPERRPADRACPVAHAVLVRTHLRRDFAPVEMRAGHRLVEPRSECWEIESWPGHRSPYVVSSLSPLMVSMTEMPPTSPGVGSTCHLSLASSPEIAGPRLSGRHSPLTLRGAPYRPGELPTVLAVQITSELAEHTNRQARVHQVPVELWLRASIDAARTLATLQRAILLDADTIVSELDRNAREFTPMLTGEVELLDYRRLLLFGEPASVTRVPASGRLELLLPAELVTAWRRDAAASRERLDGWVERQLRSAREEALAWEATAAACGARLAEWAYACMLRRSERSSV